MVSHHPQAPSDPPRVYEDDPRAGTTLIVAIVGALFVLVVVIGLQALYHHAQEIERVEKTYPVAPEELSRLRASQLEQLNQYRWIDPPRGVVAVPIERAMELVARDQGVNPAVRPPVPAPGGGNP